MRPVQDEDYAGGRHPCRTLALPSLQVGVTASSAMRHSRPVRRNVTRMNVPKRWPGTGLLPSETDVAARQKVCATPMAAAMMSSPTTALRRCVRGAVTASRLLTCDIFG